MNVFAKIIGQILLFINSAFKTVDSDSEGIDRIDNFDTNIINQNRATIKGILMMIDLDLGQITQPDDVFQMEVDGLFAEMFSYDPDELLEGQDFNALMVRETSRDIVQATRVLTILRHYLAGGLS